ncbi:unnamed protein product [Diamesa serratosioi]
MKIILCTVVVAFVIGSVISERARFDNYRVYSINIENAKQLNILQELNEYPDGYNFWDPPSKVNSKIDLVVPPHQFAHFGELVKALNLKTKVKINNLQQTMDKERPMKQNKADDAMSWVDYHRLDVIYAWLDQLQTENPGVITVMDIGKTYEGRTMKMVKLSKKTGNRAIMIEANIHAREWIGSATATWVLHHLLTSNDTEVIDLANNIDWYIIPVTNPDGYEYTHTDNRNWRKTRSIHSLLCTGVDPNRNFGFNWMQGGASQVPCSDTYAGPKAFSENETLAVENFMKEHSSKFDAFLSLHSYSQLILYPYGHTTEKFDIYDELQAVGEAAAERLFQKHKTPYEVGNSFEVLYQTSGASPDHVLGKYKVPFAYTIEMRDTGRFGFFLPADQIISNAEEVFDSFVGLVQKARELGYF